MNSPRLPSKLVWPLSMLMHLSLLGCTVVEAPTPDEAGRYAQLGEHLFFDSSLSADGQISCASCHDPARAFTDGRPVSVGVHGRKGTRNASSLVGLDVYSSHFWDGREARLEDAVLQPLTNPVEMGLDSLDEVIAHVGSSSEYAPLLAALQLDEPGELGAPELARALRSYVDTLKNTQSPYDRHLAPASHDGGLNASEREGLKLFTGKAECAQCHALDGANARFTDNRFHHTGVGFDAISGHIPELIVRLASASGDAIPLGHRVLQDADIAAAGRFIQTRKPADLAAFRTPSLRDVALTAPYMHDGSIDTLEAAVDHELYYRGLSRGEPIALTAQERADLLAFLHALTGKYADRSAVGVSPAPHDATDDQG